MAERRMFAKTIIDSDHFVDMPLSTQALYFHLAIQADDDGFVSNPKRVMRTVGCGEDEIKLLIAKGFIIPFDSGICVITHWKIHNYIQSDRYKETVHLNEKKLVEVKPNRVYALTESPCLLPLCDMDTQCIHDVSNLDAQYRLDKSSLDKNREGNNTHSNSENPPKGPKSILNITQQKLFNRFWDVYPKKSSKGDAQKAFRAINPDEELVKKIIDGVERAKRHDTRFREMQYTPYPASWLRATGWEDNYDNKVSHQMPQKRVYEEESW